MTPEEGNNSNGDLSARAAELTRSVEALAASVGQLREYSRRSRQLIWLTAVGLACVLALSVALAFVAIEANNASHRAEAATSAAARNREAQRITCESGNQARAAQIQLWTYVLDLSAQSNPNPTPEQRRRIEQFRAYINAVFAPRNCADPTSPPPTVTPLPSRSPTR